MTTPLDENLMLPRAAVRPRWLAVRLSVQMFLAYATQGAWVPIFAVYTDQLGFTALATAWAFSAYSISSLVAPLAWGQVADRWLAAERCISICGVAAAGTMLVLPSLDGAVAVFVACVVFWFFVTPINSLSAALTMRQVEDPERHFGAIRLWGTVGWAAAGWLVTGWLLVKPALLGSGAIDLADSFYVAAIFGFLLSVYSLTLPTTLPAPGTALAMTGLRRLLDAPLRSLALLQQPALLTFCVCLFGAYITMPFAQQLIPLLLARHGVGRDRLPMALTLAQSSETVTLALLPLLLSRCGMRGTLLVGLGAWAVELVLFTQGQPLPLMLAALTIQGLFITCYYVAGQVFVNRLSASDVRASAQGLIVLVVGVGLLAGNLLVGGVRAYTGDQYELAFLPAAALAVGLVILFATGFTTTPASKPASAEMADALVTSQEMS